MSNENLASKSIFGWKGVIIACVLGSIFMAILYLAISNEPDYMPSQQRKKQQEMQMPQQDAAQQQNTNAHSATSSEHNH
ncbi:DUF4199 domain-containing protein [Acinetobacter puyangensis]|uniref:DUF4199 domain-containing protein n=1 Tax=Acinetobacter puyangensis TaxID=1096779 RepID=UPI003A4D2003